MGFHFSRPTLSLVIVLITGGNTFSQAPVKHANSEQVELRYKIPPSTDYLSGETMSIILYRPDGTIARQQITFAGATVRFKHLVQDVYRICVNTVRGDESCESVDLVLPPARKAGRVDKTLALSALKRTRADAYSISVSELDIPGEARTEFADSVEALMHGDDAAELAHLQRAVMLAPSYAAALNNLGAHWLRSGNLALAVGYFGRLAELHPESYRAWTNLGKSYVASGQPRTALPFLMRALTLQPDNVEVNASVARAYYYVHEWSKARRYFERVLKLDRASYEFPQLFLMHIAMAQSRPEEAAGYIRDYLEVHPHSPKAEALRGTLDAILSGRYSTTLSAWTTR